VRAGGVRNDAVLLGAVLLASAARVQLVVLVPAALTAVVLESCLGRDAGEGVLRSVVSGVGRHRLLFGVFAVALAAAGIASLVGEAVFSIFGRYANVGRAGLPNLWHFLNLLVRHLAGLDLAAGVVPFVGATVAAVAFARARFRGAALPFAAVAASVTAWLLVEVAFDAAKFDSATADVPRIHERFLIYVAPFFLIALLATTRLPEAKATRRVCLGAAAFATLLPLVIPFHTVVNQTALADTFGLQLFARPSRGKLVPVPHVAALVVLVAATLSLLYVQERRRTRVLLLITLVPLTLSSILILDRTSSGSTSVRSLLPARADWVDAAKPNGQVILITGPAAPTSALETAYSNLTISRLYYLCRPAFGTDFGERQATIDNSGHLRGPSGYLNAPYAVVPTTLAARGRLVATNPQGHELLIAPPHDRLSVDPTRGARPKCR
jgi:hypothetical protein